MVWGCPVIAARTSGLAQICGDGAAYADPDAAAEWVAIIERLRGDPSLRQLQVATGHARARLFSWSQIAAQYLTLMARMDGLPYEESIFGFDRAANRTG